MNIRLARAALFVSLGVATACSSEVGDVGDVGASQSALQAPSLSAAELAATKQTLVSIAKTNMVRVDNLAAVRAQVEPLIAKLAEHFGERTAVSKLPLVQGAWRQLWSDYPYPMSPFTSMDLSQVYQVVDAGGHYWNIGDQRAIGLFGLTGVLRGAYEPDGTKINLEFTNVGFRFGKLRARDHLVDLANGLESGSRAYVSLPGGGRAPKGPVGIQGTLETLYVDADLRVDRGTQDDFVDTNGNVLVPGYGPRYFVLEKVTTPAK